MKPGKKKVSVLMENFTAYWKDPDQVREQNQRAIAPVFQNLNLKFKMGKLSCVIGRVGKMLMNIKCYLKYTSIQITF